MRWSSEYSALHRTLTPPPPFVTDLNPDLLLFVMNRKINAIEAVFVSIVHASACERGVLNAHRGLVSPDCCSSSVVRVTA